MTPEQKTHYYEMAERLIAEQSLRNAIIAGIIIAIATTAIWVAIAGVTGRSMGYLAIPAGAAIGYVVQTFGKGLNAVYVFVAIALTLVACVAGDLMVPLAIEAIDAINNPTPDKEILIDLDPRGIGEFVAVSNGLLDLGFWILAVSAAGYIARRRLNHQEQLALFTLKNSPGAAPEEL